MEATDYADNLLKESVLQALSLPSSLDNNFNVISSPVNDAYMVSCADCISESLARILLKMDGTLECPTCHERVTMVGPVEPLRRIYNLVSDDTDNQYGHEEKKENLLSLFYSIANTVNQQTTVPTSSKSKRLQRPSEASMSKKSDILVTSRSSSNLSKLSSNPSSNLSKLPSSSLSMKQSSNASIHTHSTQSMSTLPTAMVQGAAPQPQLSSIKSPIQKNKEFFFVKCFPTYRRHYQYSTHSKFLKAKSKTFIQTRISPGAQFFALLSPRKWEVYEIPEDPSKPPVLRCVGKSTGEYGPNFENLEKPPMNELREGNTNANDFLKKLADWEHLYCSISDSYLVISGTHGILRVYDLGYRGRPVYLYASNFPIRCIDISPSSELVAYGITGKDRVSGAEHALIMMHKLNFNNGLLFKVDSTTVKLPYRDPINKVSFSTDSNYLSCSTALESRFLTVLVKDAEHPKLVMKSLRTLDTSLESEGITDIKMFDNSRFMCVTSVAFNASPIIVDNNIALTNGLETVAQPKLVMKLSEVGTQIHKCAISPRNDAVAFVDRNGTVYLMNSTRMDQDHKRFFIVDQVSNAFRERESASAMFSADGHRLYLVDRKGILYVNDFASGLPKDPEITRCKPLER